MTDSLKQTLRDGRYAVIRVLGEGSQAATFEAVDKRGGALVAIKRFRVRGASSWKEVELAEREARVLAALSEVGGVSRGKSGAAFAESGAPSQRPMPSNLPRYVEHFEEDGELYLVTELIEGESLLALRKRGARFSEADVTRLLRDGSLALEFLHGRSPPVIHRDIKPSNVLRRPDGSFALIDFGSVRDCLKPEGGSTVVGTFGYMAPEQFQGRAMPTSDVYALGATALSMLTGQEPEKLPHKGLAIDVASALSRLRVSPAMVAALSAMLDPNPDTRAARVEPLLASLPASSSPPPAPPPAGPARSRREDVRSDARYDRRDEKRARKEERREQKRAEREGRYEGRDARRVMSLDRSRSRSSTTRRGPLFPPPLGPLFLVGLSLAQVAVTLALGVFVPILFTILSVVFGKGMREAGRTTRSAGKVAVEAMERAKEIVRGAYSREEGVGVRVVADEEPRAEAASNDERVRVEGDAPRPAWAAGVERAAREVGRAAEEVRRAAEEEQAAREVAEAEEEAREAEREGRGPRERRR